jgi:hypothetical protein
MKNKSFDNKKKNKTLKMLKNSKLGDENFSKAEVYFIN